MSDKIIDFETKATLSFNLTKHLKQFMTLDLNAPNVRVESVCINRNKIKVVINNNGAIITATHPIDDIEWHIHDRSVNGTI